MADKKYVDSADVVVTHVPSSDVTPDAPGGTTQDSLIPVIGGDPQVDAASRLYANTYFENNPKLADEYLLKRGYEAGTDAQGNKGYRAIGTQGQYGPLEANNLQWNLLGMAKEAALDLVEGADNVLKSLPMMAAGGWTGGIGLGALSEGAITPAMEKIGADQAGISYDGNDAMGAGTLGAIRGGIGGALGVGMQKALAAVNPLIRKQTAFRIFNRVFGVPDKTIGQSVAEEGTIANSGDLLENPLEMVYEAMNEFNILKPNAGKSGPITATLNDVTGRLDGVGTVLGSTVDQLDKTVKVPFSEVENFFNGTVTKIKQDMGLAGVEGLDTDPAAKLVDGVLNPRIEAFKEELGAKLTPQQNQLIENYKLLTDGGKVNGEKMLPIADLDAKITAMETKLGPNPGRVSSANELRKIASMKAELADRKAQLSSIEADALRLMAEKENPTISFRDLYEFKVGLQSAAEPFFANPGTRAQGQAMNRMGGILGEYVGKVATAGDEVLGPEFVQHSRVYSLLSDAKRLLLGPTGAEQKLRTLPETTGLGRFMSNTFPIKAPYGGVNIAAHGPRAFYGIRGLAGEQNVDAAFSEAVDMLPSAVEPGAFSQIMQGARGVADAINQRTPSTKFIAGTQLANKISDFMSPPNANADSDTRSDTQMLNLKQSMALTLLSDNGIISKDQRRSGVDLDTLPPQAVQQVFAMVQQATQPLEDAIKFGSDEEVGAAMSQVIKQYPDLFSPPKTGIIGEVTVGGKPKLFDPMDRARYAQQVEIHPTLPWNEKAKIISDLNYTNTATVIPK